MDFTLAPEKKIVSGHKGKSVTLQWNIIKENITDQLAAANLYLLGTVESHLYAIDLFTERVLGIKAKNIFGERISANIKNDTKCLLILQNLQYGDANYFRLEVQIRCGGVLSKIKKSMIQLNVLGMKKFFFSLIPNPNKAGLFECFFFGWVNWPHLTLQEKLI